MKTLEEIYEGHNNGNSGAGHGDKGTVHSYIPEYERLFSPFRNKKINILEIGIAYGESLELWDKYFPNANIFGADIHDIEIFSDQFKPNGYKDDERFTIWISDATKPEFLDVIGDTKFDIIIDDGLHTPEANAKTLKNFWPLLKPDGIYFVEDAWPFDMMKSQEITDNGWFKNKTHIYNDFKYNMFLHELENKHVERYDLRENQQADSYIFKVTNAR